jgi:aminoglycoside phosphotransferase (APT) family kinase protein
VWLADEAAGPAEREVWASLTSDGLPEDLHDWAVRNRSRLTEATIGAAEVFRCDEWAHCDVRADNLVLDPDGSVWITDWNWLLHAPEWADLGLLLPQLHADGVDLGPAYASPLLADVPADHLDAGLAWLAALMFVSAPQEPFPGASPYLRDHQRWTGAATLRLLRERWS